MNIKLEEPKYYLLNCRKIDPSLSYELFLLEVLNNSKYFMSKSNGEKFISPESESHGENDAITNSYQIDFKLLVSKNMMQLLAQNKPNIDYSLLNKGIIMVKEKDEINNEKSENILLRLLKFNLEDNNDDIKDILENLKKEKNLFIFYPYQFKTNTIMTIDQSKRLLEATLNNILKYRTNCQPDKDTFICINLNKQFILFEWVNNQLCLTDVIEEFWCPTYRNLKLISLY